MQEIIGTAVKDPMSERLRDIRLPGLFMLAISATGTAIFMSMLAGWQRGGWLSERIVWCALSVVLVLCAHLIPALCRGASAIVRWVAGVLWVACMIAVSFGHATFFLLSQQHAGERRADAIAVVTPPVAQDAASGRSLTAIATEQATFKAALGAASEQRCARNCAYLRANRVTLSAKIDALNVEADEARRWERSEDRLAAQADRVTTLRDSARNDPVTARLSVWIGTNPDKINLMLALAFAVVLEGVACLCWYVALRPGSSHPTVEPPVTPGVTPPVTAAVPIEFNASHASLMNSHVTADVMTMPQASPIHADHVMPDDEIVQLGRDIATGRVRPTVAGIRRHLGCSQAKASTLRRQIGELQVSPQPTSSALSVVRDGEVPICLPRDLLDQGT
ncbi:hypothetical protein B0G71_0070 [Paraburkholderia sp. BL27I4N3]|uniref:hypothetical protein n=1 Tax=Paraburkholderia sp. BL27I4N3 TaxID=1938805 RepID=UPI000E396DEA|nr:hypothetical protein [Paraburkholderia sp. BL27I4N3]REE17132.1 hypothetical protein B0G71_0070 [Paraburkholderia sp. BL27I4N3]